MLVSFNILEDFYIRFVALSYRLLRHEVNAFALSLSPAFARKTTRSCDKCPREKGIGEAPDIKEKKINVWQSETRSGGEDRALIALMRRKRFLRFVLAETPCISARKFVTWNIMCRSRFPRILSYGTDKTQDVSRYRRRCRRRQVFREEGEPILALKQSCRDDRKAF